MNSNRKQPGSPRAVPTAGRLLIGLFVIFMLVSAACNLPFSTSKNLPTATAPAPTATIQPTPTQPMPPTVIETSPLPEGVLSSAAGVSLTFDQSMDRASVEAAIKVEPAYAGRFEWKDDSTVKYVPEQPFTTTQDVSVTVDTSAHAKNGMALLHPLTYSFKTSGNLKVADRLPTPDATLVDPASKIVVTFNRAVIALEMIHPICLRQSAFLRK